MKILTIAEAAKLFKVTRTTILNWSKQNKIEYVTVPQGKTFYKIDIDTYNLLKENLEQCTK